MGCRPASSAGRAVRDSAVVGQQRGQGLPGRDLSRRLRLEPGLTQLVAQHVHVRQLGSTSLRAQQQVEVPAEAVVGHQGRTSSLPLPGGSRGRPPPRSPRGRPDRRPRLRLERAPRPMNRSRHRRRWRAERAPGHVAGVTPCHIRRRARGRAAGAGRRGRARPGRTRP
jgi:hypothetical protein